MAARPLAVLILALAVALGWAAAAEAARNGPIAWAQLDRRGPVVVESDLAAALQSGGLAGAVLDVFETQPLPADSALRRHPGVLLTPHLAGITREAEHAMSLLAVDTLRALLAGERPTNIVNPEVFAPPDR